MFLKTLVSFNCFYLLSFFFNQGKVEQLPVYQINDLSIVCLQLSLPQAHALLNRSEILEQMHKKLIGDNKTQTLALVGIGGSGKTTLARHYAQLYPASVVWEINAETSGTLINSFENMAFALAQGENDKKFLKSLEDIKDTKERERKILQFVKDKLKLYKEWLLIFDNVEQFSDIQTYFPTIPDQWGQGKVIITTRNDNIRNNNYIDTVLSIGELNPQEKLELFTKIIHHEKTSFSISEEKEEVEKFLERIPPFVLDVSIAAHYLGSNNISYEEYLNYLKENNEDFEDLQKNILEKNSDYNKTRYNIIILSLKKLIEKNKDFADLLLLISLIDSQNIPKDLLSKIKNDALTDDFIFHLKKYSLITTELFKSSCSIPILSLHRSTQEISLAYLTKSLNLTDSNQSLQTMGRVLKDYTSQIIDEEELLKMKLLLPHCEAFIGHDNILDELTKNIIITEMGGIHFHLGNHLKAKSYLEKSLKTLNKKNAEDYFAIAQTLIYLGNVYRSIEDYQKASNCLEKSFVLYKKYFPQNQMSLARVLGYLGIVYREMGDYEKAKQVHEQALTIYKDHFPENHMGFARTSEYLGLSYKALGNYIKSSILIEQSLKIYEQHFPKNHVRIGWALAYLGTIYEAQGNYEKAIIFLEKALLIYKEVLPENHLSAIWTSVYLGMAYKELGNYKKAQELLEQNLALTQEIFPQNTIKLAWIQEELGKFYRDSENYIKAKNLLESSLQIHKEKYGNDHIQTARTLNDLGKLFLLEGQLEKADILFKETLAIFNKNKHPDCYKALENLATLFSKKKIQAKSRGDLKQSNELKIKEIKYLTQSLEVLNTSFPKDSPHIARLEKKLKSYKQNGTNKIK